MAALSLRLKTKFVSLILAIINAVLKTFSCLPILMKSILGQTLEKTLSKCTYHLW